MIDMINVVLCGGTGSRLWPLSRKKYPKQFHKIYSEKTLLKETVDRTNLINSSLVNSSSTIFVTNNNYKNIINEQLDNPSNYSFLLEPFGKNTAPAILLSCLYNKYKYPENNPVMTVLSSDHIFDNAKFSEIINDSILLAQQNKIVTLGIKPIYPETGYGYIKKTNDSTKIVEFVEKPDRELAKQYLVDGNFLWNSGTFVFKRDVMINEFKKFQKDMFNTCTKIINSSCVDQNSVFLNEEYFNSLEDISIDYAIMEYTDLGHCLTYDGIWNDVGSWNVLFDIKPKDENNNCVSGQVVTENTHNCFLRSDEGLIATIGLDNIVAVKTEDCVLIADMDSSQDVKKIINKLGDDKLVKEFRTDYRPWGYYRSIEGTDSGPFKVKHIVVYPKKRLSLQSHKMRSEHWVVVKGTACAQKGENKYVLNKNDNIFIEKCELHRIENIGDENMEFIETQIGDYLGEDDIIRYEDDFGRK